MIELSQLILTSNLIKTLSKGRCGLDELQNLVQAIYLGKKGHKRYFTLLILYLYNNNTINIK